MPATQTALKVSKSNPKTSTKGASKSNPAKKLSGEDKADALAAKAAKARAGKAPKAEPAAKPVTPEKAAEGLDIVKLYNEQGRDAALASIMTRFQLDVSEGSIARRAINEAFSLGLLAKKPRGGTRGPRGTGKSHEAGKLFLRPEGVTSREVLTLTGWPAVSMPALAKRAGITIYKRGAKDGAVVYFGRK
jgi:hypothetical protein